MGQRGLKRATDVEYYAGALGAEFVSPLRGSNTGGRDQAGSTRAAAGWASGRWAGDPDLSCGEILKQPWQMPCGVGAQLIRSGPQRLAIYELLTPTAGAAGRSRRLL